MNSDRRIGVGVIIVGLLLFFVLIPFGVVEPGNLDNPATAPRFWPEIIAAIIVAMGVLMLLRKSETPPAIDWHWHCLPGLGIVFGALLGFYFVLDWLGMVVAGMLLSAGLMGVGGERRPLLLGSCALAVPLLLYVFFVYIAGIPLPLGVFEAWRG